MSANEESNTTKYPVVKENAFYKGYLILFTAPNTGRVVELGTGMMEQYKSMLGETSDSWAESYFNERSDLDPASYPEPAKDD